MSWLTKLLPPKIKREQGPQRRGQPAGRSVEQVPFL